MKKLFSYVALGLCMSSGLSYAATAPAPSSEMDKVSYAIGYNVGTDFKKQEIAVVPAQLQAGMEAALSGAVPVMTPGEMKSVLDTFQKEMMEKMMEKEKQVAERNLKKSQAYLADIASQPGVQKITDGLYYKVLTAGNGPMPKATDSVEVNYEGSLMTGKVFDSSFERGKPVTFGLNQVIPGWTQALQKMPVGSTWMLYISPELAYGKFAPPQIGPNQALVFKVQLIAIMPKTSS